MPKSHRPHSTRSRCIAQDRGDGQGKVPPTGVRLEIQAWYPEQFLSKAGEAVVNNDNGRSARATAVHLDSKTFTDTLQWIVTMNKENLMLNGAAM